MSARQPPPPASADRLHATVHGRVQGVNFRYYSRQRAEDLGLSGWVANRPDGAVEVVAEGPRGALAELLVFLQTGPALARVERVEIQWEPATGEFRGFRIGYR